MEYPKYLYKAGEEAKLVNDKAEEKALGPGWTHKPSGKPDAPKPVVPAPKPPAPVAPKPVVPVAPKPPAPFKP